MVVQILAIKTQFITVVLRRENVIFEWNPDLKKWKQPFRKYEKQCYIQNHTLS